MNIFGSVVLVTGANRGIGKAFAEEFLNRGARKVYLGVRNPESALTLTKEYSGKLVPLLLDVTNPDQIRKAAIKASDVNILVNNAGVLYGGTLLDFGRMENARREMEVNYFGPMMMIRAFVPVIKSNGGGAIMNVSSIAGIVAYPGIPTYCASKAANYFLSQEARIELAKDGIRVSSVHPGPVDTDMARDFPIAKVSPGHIARESIKALETDVETVFPDSYARKMYALFRRDSELAAEEVQKTFVHGLVV